MAPNTPRKRPAPMESAPTPASKRKMEDAVRTAQKLGTRPLRLAVGSELTCFWIQEGYLAETGFFDVEGEPEPLADAELFEDATNQAKENVTDLDVKFEEDAETIVDGIPSVEEDFAMPASLQIRPSPSATALPKPAKPKAHYYLTRKEHNPSAFAHLVIYLTQSRIPPKPTTPTACRTLLQTYILAIKYSVTGLQNCITDVFRAYHQSVNINFDHLIWLLNNTKSFDANIKLAHYFVAQVAFDIAEKGFDSFLVDNEYLEHFVVNKGGESDGGERASAKESARLELFRRLAEHASASKGVLGDPARTGEDWHVEEGEDVRCEVVD